MQPTEPIQPPEQTDAAAPPAVQLPEQPPIAPQTLRAETELAAGAVAVEQTIDTDQEPALDGESQGPTELPQQEPLTWQSIEYIQHDKSPIWYIGFVSVVIILMAVALWLGSWTFAVLVPVMAVALMVYSHRPARQLQYALSDKGLYINDQLHPMGEFKSFGVVNEGELHALTLIPVKRFRPSLTVYFPLEVGERLVDFLGSYIPMHEIQPDVFDKIVRKLRI